jgi:glutamate-1-semialdehyde 2,1-aminomutase
VDSIFRTYKTRTPKSAELALRRETLFPGGSFRPAVFHKPYPITLTHGEGVSVYDVDGNEYIDLNSTDSVLVHGHAYPPIVEAAQRAAANGSMWLGANGHADELAATIISRVDSVERVRFTNSGTESAMLAIKIARAITGRQKILMPKYGFNGTYEVTEAGSFRGGGPVTYIAEFGNAESFEQVLADHGSEIACVIMEPVLTAGGVITPPVGFTERVIQAAKSAGAVSILDEVVTSRLSVGGEQARQGVTPELTTFGKTIGGGFPVGAVGGSAAAMDVMHPITGSMWSGGTFHSNPVTAAAGVVSLNELTAGRIATMDRLCERLGTELAQAAAKNGVPFSYTIAGSMIQFYLDDHLPAFQPERKDEALLAAFLLACLNNGLVSSQRGWIALNTQFTDDVVSNVIERAGRAFADISDSALVEALIER